MANCGKCKAKLAYPGETCPFCGHKNRQPMTWEWVTVVIEVIYWIISIAGCFFPFTLSIAAIALAIMFIF
jgi:hypothetical protein